VASPDETSAAQRLTYGGWNTEPAWSPDGRQVAFVDAFGKIRARSRIVVVDLDDRRTRILARCAGECSTPAWSPDNSSLAYLGDYPEPDGSGTTGPELRIVSANGRDDRPLARDFTLLRRTGTEVSFSWSPSGDRIAFEHLSNGDRDGKGGIFVLRGDGSGLRQLTREP
jgi:Tol biopolymer transport system component